MLIKIAGRVRGFFAGNYAENREDEQLVINNRGDQMIAQSLPELTEIVRLGNSWQGATRTGQAALTALPTTTAGLTLGNAEPATGKCYVIDSFGSWEAVIDATQTDNTAILAMMNARGSTAPSAGTVEAVSVIKSLSGRAAGGSGNSSIRRGGTVTDDGWFAHGGLAANVSPVAAGANWKVNEVQARGMYIVPPGGFFSVQAVKAAAAAAAQQFFFVRWHEAQLIYVA